MKALAAIDDLDLQHLAPKWIKPQLTRLVNEAPAGDGWRHEIRYEGYRMQARIADLQRGAQPRHSDHPASR